VVTWPMAFSDSLYTCMMTAVANSGTSPWPRSLRRGRVHHQGYEHYLERSPQAPLSLRQVDPLIRELTQYCDLIQQRIHFEEPNYYTTSDGIRSTLPLTQRADRPRKGQLHNAVIGHTALASTDREHALT
jgi:hypothetical protein